MRLARQRRAAISDSRTTARQATIYAAAMNERRESAGTWPGLNGNRHLVFTTVTRHAYALMTIMPKPIRFAWHGLFIRVVRMARDSHAVGRPIDDYDGCRKLAKAGRALALLEEQQPLRVRSAMAAEEIMAKASTMTPDQAETAMNGAEGCAGSPRAFDYSR